MGDTTLQDPHSACDELARERPDVVAALADLTFVLCSCPALAGQLAVAIEIRVADQPSDAIIGRVGEIVVSL